MTADKLCVSVICVHCDHLFYSATAVPAAERPDYESRARFAQLEAETGWPKPSICPSATPHHVAPVVWREWVAFDLRVHRRWWSHCAACSEALTPNICPLPQDFAATGFAALLCAPCAGFDVAAWLTGARDWKGSVAQVAT